MRLKCSSGCTMRVSMPLYSAQMLVFFFDIHSLTSQTAEHEQRTIKCLILGSAHKIHSDISHWL